MFQNLELRKIVQKSCNEEMTHEKYQSREEAGEALLVCYQRFFNMYYMLEDKMRRDQRKTIMDSEQFYFQKLLQQCLIQPFHPSRSQPQQFYTLSTSFKNSLKNLQRSKLISKMKAQQWEAAARDFEYRYRNLQNHIQDDKETKQQETKVKEIEKKSMQTDLKNQNDSQMNHENLSQRIYQCNNQSHQNNRIDTDSSKVFVCHLCTKCLNKEVNKQVKTKKKKNFEEEENGNVFDLNEIARKEEDTTNNYIYYHQKKELDLKKMMKKFKNLDDSVKEKTLKINYPLGQVEKQLPKISFEEKELEQNLDSKITQKTLPLQKNDIKQVPKVEPYKTIQVPKVEQQKTIQPNIFETRTEPVKKESDNSIFKIPQKEQSKEQSQVQQIQQPTSIFNKPQQGTNLFANDNKDSSILFKNTFQNKNNEIKDIPLTKLDNQETQQANNLFPKKDKINEEQKPSGNQLQSTSFLSTNKNPLFENKDQSNFLNDKQDKSLSQNETPQQEEKKKDMNLLFQNHNPQQLLSVNELPNQQTTEEKKQNPFFGQVPTTIGEQKNQNIFKNTQQTPNMFQTQTQQAPLFQNAQNNQNKNLFGNNDKGNTPVVTNIFGSSNSQTPAGNPFILKSNSPNNQNKGSGLFDSMVQNNTSNMFSNNTSPAQNQFTPSMGLFNTQPSTTQNNPFFQNTLEKK